MARFYGENVSGKTERFKNRTKSLGMGWRCIRGSAKAKEETVWGALQPSLQSRTTGNDNQTLSYAPAAKSCGLFYF